MTGSVSAGWGDGSAPDTAGRLISLSRPLDHDLVAALPLPATLLLVQGHAGERFYWNDPGPISFAGVGVAAELFAWGDGRFTEIAAKAKALFTEAVIDNEQQPLAVPRLFGGFAFRNDFVPDNAWANFHPAYFVLPHYQILQDADHAWLTLNALAPADENPADLLPDLNAAVEAKREELHRQFRRPTPTPVPNDNGRIHYPMSRDQWTEMLTAAGDRIRADQFQKVVLSRVAEIRFPHRVRLSAPLAYLDRQYPECYRFLLEPRPHNAFYGATPELIAQVEGHELTTMALAGSMPRGTTAEEDAAHGRALLHSEKNRYEHNLVVESIVKRLRPLAADLDVPHGPERYTLSNIHHLHTPVRATLKQATGVLPLLDVLHPTPALGGTPRDRALGFIREAEPVPRGWYAAPVGWVDHNLDGVFGVAIRSAVAQDERVWAYAGVGVVAQSDPAEEWRETEHKFRPMLDALRIEA